MSWTLAEGLVDEIQDVLADNLPAKLTALEAAYADGISLPAPGYGIGEKALASLSGVAWCYILADRWTVPGAGQWRTGAYVDAQHECRVGLWTFDADEQRLRRRLYRYARALFEVLDAAQSAGEMTFQLAMPAAVDFSPVVDGASTGTVNSLGGALELSLQFMKLEGKA